MKWVGGWGATGQEAVGGLWGWLCLYDCLCEGHQDLGAPMLSSKPSPAPPTPVP